VRSHWLATIPAARSLELTVETDAEIRLDAWSPDGRFRSKGELVRAPGVAESRDVTLVLAPKPEPAFCTLRVVDPGGAPVPGSDVFWQLGGRPERGIEDVTPNPALLQRGRAGLRGELQLETATLARFIGKRVADSRSRSGRRRADTTDAFLEVFRDLDSPKVTGASFAAALELPRLAPDDETDLGTVVLVEVPVLIAGRARDPEGRGVPDVDVAVRENRNEAARRWLARTDAAGRFRIHARGETPSLEVWTSRERWYREGEYRADGKRDPLLVPIGAGDVEITLHRCGWARGSLLVDPGISLHDLSLAALPEPSPDVGFRLEADGRFLVHAPPGRRTLIVRSQLAPPDPIAEVGDFVLEEAKESVDPRLDPIDLRRELDQVELRVTSTDGSPISNALLRLVPNGGRPIVVPRSTDPFGRAIVTTPLFDSWLIVGTPDHWFRAIGFDPAFQDVELAPAVLVRVKVEGPAERILKSEKFRPWLELTQPEGGDAFSRVWNSLPPQAARRRDSTTFDLKACMAGTYRLSWQPDARLGSRHSLRDRPWIEVTGRDALVEVVEKLSERDVREIESRLRR
jgi:hypothetical protein